MNDQFAIDLAFMRIALEQARQAAEAGEVSEAVKAAVSAVKEDRDREEDGDKLSWI